MAQKGRGKNIKRERSASDSLLEATARISNSFTSNEHLGYPKINKKGIRVKPEFADELTRRLRPHVRAAVLDPPPLEPRVAVPDGIVFIPDYYTDAQRNLMDRVIQEHTPVGCPRCRSRAGYSHDKCRECGVHRDRPVRAA